MVGRMNHAITKAEAQVWNITTPDGADREFRAEIFRKFPHRFALGLAQQYKAIHALEGLTAANLYLLNCSEQMGRNVYRIASSEDELRAFAKARASQCERIAPTLPAEAAYARLSQLALSFEIPPPEIKDKTTAAGAVKRLCDELWWRKRVRKIYGRKLEAVAIQAGLVRKQAGIYASDETVAKRRRQKQTTNELLEALLAENDQGQEYSLKALYDLSISNPKNRRAEMMVRNAGFERLAIARQDKALFLTVTCPSKMHSHHASSGHRNKNYNDTTPKQANQYLGTVWARIRAQLDRDGIRVYGFRITEPQHDGCPHSHFLLFVAPENSEKVLNIFRTYALQEDGDEPGAEEHRFTVVEIDPDQGTATGYIAKYISKNIDGHGLDKDLYGTDAATAAERVEAWASTWGIRQFQQIGGVPVTVWRELRRMSPQENPELEAIRQAADSGDWARFTELMGGPTATREEHTLKLYRMTTGELSRYGEVKGEVIAGVEFRGVPYIRPRPNWNIVLNPARNRFEIEIPKSGKDALNCTQVPGRFQNQFRNQGWPGSGTVPEVSEQGLAPVPEKFRNFSESSGPGARTGASPLPLGASPGLEPRTEFLNSMARSASSHLEFCQ